MTGSSPKGNGPLSPSQVIGRLQIVRAAVVEHDELRKTAAACGLNCASPLVEFLRRRMAYRFWPPSLDMVDAALAAAQSGAEQHGRAQCRSNRFKGTRAQWSPSPAQRRVIAVVLRGFDADVDLVRGHGRNRFVAQPRFAVIWALRQVWPALSSNQIGDWLGGRDHSTIIAGERRAVELREADEHFRAVTDLALAAVDGEACAIGPVAPPSVVAGMVERHVVRCAEREQRERQKLLASAGIEIEVDAFGSDGPDGEIGHYLGDLRAVADGSRMLLSAIRASYPERCAQVAARGSANRVMV